MEEERKAASPTMGCSVLESQDSSSALGPPVKRLVGVLGVASIHLLPPPTPSHRRAASGRGCLLMTHLPLLCPARPPQSTRLSSSLQRLRGTFFTSTLILLNSMLGTSVLAIPWALSQVRHRRVTRVTYGPRTLILLLHSSVLASIPWALSQVTR